MLASLWWWLAVQLIALCATPLCLTLFRPLADRGYGLSKAFGLLLFGYGTWILVVSNLFPNSRITYVVVLALAAGGSYLVWRRDGRALLDFWRQRRGLLLFEEALFLAAYLGFLFVRSRNADVSGTEKFMDFAFMNAITRSTTFPPLDPWLAPSPTVPSPTINYYHFGYLIQGLLLKLTGVLPAAGFNFALSLLFALAAVGAFSLGYSLTRDIWAETGTRRRRDAEARRESVPASPRPRVAASISPPVPSWNLRIAWPYVAGGLLTSYLLLVAGNLWSALRRFDNSGLWDKDFWSGIGWNATRVLVIKQGQQDVDYTINEFPSFSFLLGDLHPHVLALPFVLVAVGLAYAWLMRPPRLFRWAILGEPLSDEAPLDEEGEESAPRRSRFSRLVPYAELLPGAMILGSLYFLNSWDFPGYFVLAQAAAVAGAWWLSPHPPTPSPLVGEGGQDGGQSLPSPLMGEGLGVRVPRAAGVVALVGVLAVALFLPFHLTFKPPVVAEGGGLPLGLVPYRSLLSQFLQFWGVQLLILSPVVIAAIVGAPAVRRSVAGAFARARATAIIAREAPGWEPAILLAGSVLLVALASRLGSGVLVLCALLAAGAGWAALRALDPGARIGGRPLAFAFGAVCLAALLLAACEVVYIRDFYGGALRRMNTVFKFYYQAWLLFAIGGGAGVCWLLRLLRRRRDVPGGQLAYWAFVAAGSLLLFATMLFPYRAAILRTDSFRTAATVDGMDWMRRFHPDDYAAAQWLRENAATPLNPTPVIVEATEGPYSEFARMATQTGFPTILGWDQHERLWRGAAINQEVDQRKRDVDAIYNAGTLAQAKPLLDKYRAAFLVVGYLELQKYGGQTPEGQQRLLARFDGMAAEGLTVAFRQGQTTIYQVPRTP